MNQEISDLTNKLEKEFDNIILLIQKIKECGKSNLEKINTINSDDSKISFNTYLEYINEYINKFYNNKQIENLIENLNKKINSFLNNSSDTDLYPNLELKSGHFYSEYNNKIDSSSFSKEENISPTKKKNDDFIYYYINLLKRGKLLIAQINDNSNDLKSLIQG